MMSRYGRNVSGRELCTSEPRTGEPCRQNAHMMHATSNRPSLAALMRAHVMLVSQSPGTATSNPSSCAAACSAATESFTLPAYVLIKAGRGGAGVEVVRSCGGDVSHLGSPSRRPPAQRGHPNPPIRALMKPSVPAALSAAPAAR